jgi:Zn-dependent protease
MFELFSHLAWPQLIAVLALPLLLAITLHEVGHAYAASYFGDLTAKNAGRLTLNPINHISLLGTIVVPLALYFLHSPMIFGWANPVPINMAYLRDRRHALVMVALAGPLANALMAIIFGLVFKCLFDPLHPITFGASLISNARYFFLLMSLAGIMINTILFCFNLLPLLPLDGGRILVALLPRPIAQLLEGIEPYSLLILVLLLQFRVLDPFLGTFISFTAEWLFRLLGL